MSDEPISNNDNNYRRDTAYLDRSSLDRGGRLVAQRPPPPAKVPFQQVMDQMKDSDGFQMTPRQPDAANQDPNRQVQEVVPQEERSGSFREEMQRRAREMEPLNDQPKTKTSSTGGEKTKGKVAEQKVIGRSPLSERQSDGQGKGGQGKSAKQGQGYGYEAVILSQQLRSLGKGRIQELGQSGFLQNMKSVQVTQEAKAKMPTVFNQALMDQIIHYVRLITRKDGEKEMDVSLHEKIFKGLRLRVAMNKDKAHVTLTTTSKEIRELLLSHRRDMEQALKEKEIEVLKIDVIMAERA